MIISPLVAVCSQENSFVCIRELFDIVRADRRIMFVAADKDRSRMYPCMQSCYMKDFEMHAVDYLLWYNL